MGKKLFCLILIILFGVGCGRSPNPDPLANHQDSIINGSQEKGEMIPFFEMETFPYVEFPFEKTNDIQVQSNAPPIDTDILNYLSYSILSVNSLNCSGHDYVVAQVSNTGNEAFEYAWMGFYAGLVPRGGRGSVGTGEGLNSPGTGVPEGSWDVRSNTPFHEGPLECPPGQGMDIFYPGDVTYLYLEYEYNDMFRYFELDLLLCTLDDREGDCIYIEISTNLNPYSFNFDIPRVFFEALENYPCLVGPHPEHETIRTIKRGEIVEIAAQSQEPGYYVILDTKYNTWCYLADTAFEIHNPYIITLLPIAVSPPMPYVPAPKDNPAEMGCLVVKNLSQAPECVIPCPDPTKYPNQCNP